MGGDAELADDLPAGALEDFYGLRWMPSKEIHVGFSPARALAFDDEVLPVKARISRGDTQERKRCLRPLSLLEFLSRRQ